MSEYTFIVHKVIYLQILPVSHLFIVFNWSVLLQSTNVHYAQKKLGNIFKCTNKIVSPLCYPTSATPSLDTKYNS